jgi:phosphomevalonate kinase
MRLRAETREYRITNFLSKMVWKRKQQENIKQNRYSKSKQIKTSQLIKKKMIKNHVKQKLDFVLDYFFFIGLEYFINNSRVLNNFSQNIYLSKINL